METLSATVQLIGPALEEFRAIIFQDIDGFATTVERLETFERSHQQHLQTTITDPIWNQMRNVFIANAISTNFRFQRTLTQTGQNRPHAITITRIWYVHKEIFSASSQLPTGPDTVFLDRYRAFLARIKDAAIRDSILVLWDAISMEV